MRDIRLSYYMGQTTVTVSGTVTFHYDNAGDLNHFDRTAFVSTGVGADTSREYELVLARRRLFRGDTEIDLSLAPDGRLLGAGFDANGGGADVAGGMVAVLTLSATVATAAAAVATAAVALFKAARFTAVDPTRQQDRAPGAADPGDGSDWVELSARAEAARKLTWDLQKRALDLGRQAAGDNPPSGLADQIKTVSTSLDLARAEVASLDQSLKAWQSKHYPDRSAFFTYRFGPDDLGSVREPLDTVKKSLNELSETAREAACTLHTLVLRVDDRAAANPPAGNPLRAVDQAADDSPAIKDQKIHYRAPYRAQLAIYELAGSADVDLTKVLEGPLDWRLRQIVPIWALDRESQEKTLDVLTPRFGRSSVQVNFGDNGAVSHISVADVGPIANLSNTVSGAVQASGSGSGSPTPAAGGAAVPAAASGGSGAPQDPVLAPLQMEAAVKKVQADIAGYDKTIRDSQTDAQPPKQGAGK